MSRKNRPEVDENDAREIDPTRAGPVERGEVTDRAGYEAAIAAGTIEELPRTDLLSQREFDQLRAEIGERIASALPGLRAAFGEAVAEAISGIGERLLTIEQRLFELATRTDLEQLTPSSARRAQERETVDRSALPEVLRIRTRDGRPRHVRAGIVFGAEWKTLATADLKDGQLRSVADDQVLEVEAG